MSGHSKWSTIKHGKAVTDARRGKLFTKLANEIIVAVRQGSSDPDMNVRLRMAIQKAKDSNMPASNIERAVKRGSGESSGDTRLDEVMYEGYGPGGTAILLQALTDNRNRTVSDVRSTFTKTGCNLADAGAVAWQFEQRGVVMAEAETDDVDELALAAIDAGADDFETVDSTIHAYSSPEGMEAIRTALEDAGASVQSSELSMVPTNTVMLDDREAIRTLKLLDSLEELDDIQKVFSNADFSDDVLSEYRGSDE
jgi:YebC/PmpR family DNA-binding regulatory protein